MRLERALLALTALLATAPAADGNVLARSLNSCRFLASSILLHRLDSLSLLSRGLNPHRFLPCGLQLRGFGSRSLLPRSLNSCRFLASSILSHHLDSFGLLSRGFNSHHFLTGCFLSYGLTPRCFLPCDLQALGLLSRRLQPLDFHPRSFLLLSLLLLGPIGQGWPARCISDRPVYRDRRSRDRPWPAPC